MAAIDAWIDEFVNSSFRDAADEDYVAARAAYRMDLSHAFLWNSLQAVEKYIKAILLYNRRPTGDLVHNVKKGFCRLLEIREIPFQFASDTERFVDYINDEGPNRYRVRPTYLRDDALIGLDRTVWYLRRHCFAFGGTDRDPVRFAADISALSSDGLAQRVSFKLPGGRIEAILGRPSEARKNLVWKNLWFCARKRHEIKEFPWRVAWSRPISFMQPDVYFALKNLVKFDKDVCNYFEQSSTVEKPATKK
jgi:HEPN domain-containing protein